MTSRLKRRGSVRRNVATQGPPPPSALSATWDSDVAIDLAWIDNSTTETGFRLEMGSDGVTFGSFVLLPANTTSYNWTGLTPNTVYFFRVKATSGSGDSAYSNIAHAYTFDSDAWLAIVAMGAQNDEGERTACNNDVLTLKDQLLWNNLISYCPFSPFSATAMLVDWKRPSIPMTRTGGSFTYDGFLTTADGYIDTNLDISLTSTNIDNFVISLRTSVDTADVGFLMGSYDTVAFNQYTIENKVISGDPASAAFVEDPTTEIDGIAFDYPAAQIYLSIAKGAWTADYVGGVTDYGVHIDRKNQGFTNGPFVPTQLPVFNMIIGTANIDTVPDSTLTYMTTQGFFVLTDLATSADWEITKGIMDTYNSNYGR